MSTDYNTISYTVERAVATVLLDRPKVLNSFNAEMRSELTAALNAASLDDKVRVVVLGGVGRAFSAGADLKDLPAGGLTLEMQLLQQYKPCFDAVMGMSKPVISAINGSASGVGLSLALVCDLAVMAEDAFLLSPFSTIGLIPDGGLTWLLPRFVGPKVAYQLCIECERIPAARAVECGMVNRLAPTAEAITHAQAWAAELATRAPISLAHTKWLIQRAMHSDYETAFRAEARLQDICANTEDSAEGIAAFLARRPPVFKGR